MSILPALVAAVVVYVITGPIKPKTRRTARRTARPSRRVPLETRLRHAGVTMSPARYRATVAGSMVATWLVANAITGSAPLATLAAVAVGFAPRAFYRRRREQALTARVAAWPEAIRDVLTQLSVGQTLHRALIELGRSGPPVLRPAWRNYTVNAAVLDVPAALAQIRADLADPVSDHVLEALEAAHDRGTTVVLAVLRALADQVTRDVQLREQIITSQAETHAQAVLAMVLPFAVLTFLVASSDAFERFYASPRGWVVVGLGTAMAVFGWKLIKALGRIPVEPRVLQRRGDTR